jgi:uncharacterized protein (TIGR03437 family)
VVDFTVTATVNGVATVITFTETATAQPGAAVEGAGFSTTLALAPGGISSLFGSGMSSGTEQAAVIPLPTTLAINTSLKVVTSTTTLTAPLYYASPSQINFQLPFEIAGPTVSLILSTGGVDSAPLAINVADTSPGIFITNSASGAGAVLHGLTNAPVNSSNPAKPGEIIVVYCAGLGAVTPAVLSGSPPSNTTNSTANANVTATIGGTSATVQFAGLAPSFVGLYQVNMVVPATTTAGSAVNVIVTANNRASNTATIPVAAN